MPLILRSIALTNEEAAVLLALTTYAASKHGHDLLTAEGLETLESLRLKAKEVSDRLIEANRRPNGHMAGGGWCYCAKPDRHADGRDHPYRPTRQGICDTCGRRQSVPTHQS